MKAAAPGALRAAAAAPRPTCLQALLLLNFLLILLACATTAQRQLARLDSGSRRRRARSSLRRLTALPLPQPSPPLPAALSGTVRRPVCQLPEDLAPVGAPPLVDIAISSEFSARTRRDAIRAGYGAQARALGMRLRFFVGEAAASDVSDAWRKGPGSGREGDVAAQLAHEALARASEQRQFGDLVVLPIMDTYNNLTLKTLAMATHTAVCGRGQFFVKTDDDVFIYAQRLQGRLAKVKADLTLYKRALGVYMGTFWENMPPITATDSKNFEPQWNASLRGKFFTPFAGGPFYLLSRPALAFLARNAHFLNTKWRNEDMAMSTWMQGLDVEAVDEERIKLLHWKWSHEPYIALHNIDDREDIEGWHLRQAALNSGAEAVAGV